MDVNTGDVTMGIGNTIGRALKAHLHAPEWQWLSAQGVNFAVDPKPAMVARVFTSVPRQFKSRNTPPIVPLNESYDGPNGLPLVVRKWSAVRLARVWLLLHMPKLEKTTYLELIERLFTYGDMEESVALYSALPVYHHPEAWQNRCKEGIRSNMGPVRHAVMVDNAYPARFLNEEAWNQLVLKAFFTDEDVPHIMGLKQRNNLQLAQALTDYAYERYAAQREVNPMLWILVGPFMDERAYHLMVRIWQETRQPLEQQAIAYAFKNSSLDRAKQFLNEYNVPNSLMEYRNTPWENWANA